MVLNGDACMFLPRMVALAMSLKSVLPPNFGQRAKNPEGIFGSLTSPSIQEALHSVSGANLIEASSLMSSPSRR
ncbi:hypothetical protein ACRAWG_28755 [Methylobacterium sp. P31]